MRNTVKLIEENLKKIFYAMDQFTSIYYLEKNKVNNKKKKLEGVVDGGEETS